MPTWFITGCAGFIGSNLCERLLRAGVMVVGLDNFATGSRANVERVAKLGGESFRFIEADIRDRDAVDDAASGCGIAVHLAALVSVQHSLEDPGYCNAVNVDGFQNVLSAAVQAGVGRFVHVSSCAVYGDNPSLPLSEGEEPAPLSPYAASKLANEHYVSSLVSQCPDMTMVGLRLFNVYGPWQDPSGDYAGVISKWIDLRVKGKRPVMYGDGSASRDFSYVGDVCRLISDLELVKGLVSGAVYNLGTGHCTTLEELDATISKVLDAADALGTDQPCECRPWRDGDILHSLADISRVRTELGYQPDTDLATGIRKLLAIQYGLGSGDI